MQAVVAMMEGGDAFIYRRLLLIEPK